MIMSSKTPILFIPFLIGFIFFGFKADIPDSNLPFVVCLGQSNMAGRGSLLPEDSLGKVNSNIFLWNDENEWEVSIEPTNKYSNIRKSLTMQEIGPAMGMALQLSHRFEKIGLLVNARGGSSIVQWQKGAGYYEQSLKRIRAAMKRGRLIGVIWHQGESDRKRADKYLELLTEFIQNLREDTGLPELPVIVGQIGNWKNNSDEINQVLNTVPSVVPKTGCVTAVDLSHKGDSLHFSREGQFVLGTRYGIELMKFL
ncbi:MAG: hypothetical protein RJA52_1396 [Bacteroidota bacterium]|jgi:hypothetical protein